MLLEVMALDNGDWSLGHFLTQHQLAAFLVGAFAIIALLFLVTFILHKIEDRAPEDSSESERHQ